MTLPKPYYDSDGITLYHGDCREIVPHIAADCMVTDPPYGLAYESDRVPNRIRRPIQGDQSTAARDEVLAMWSGPALVFGRWDKARPSSTKARLIWSKGSDPGMGDLSMPWGNSDEEIYVIGDGWRGVRGANVLVFNKPPVNNRPDHPTPKPVALMHHLISRCPLGTILDPFAGSGTTLVAAKQLGRRAIGIEIEERYCEIAAKRLAQGVLFTPPQVEKHEQMELQP